MRAHTLRRGFGLATLGLVLGIIATNAAAISVDISPFCPSNETVQISYALNQSGQVTVEIRETFGAVVRTLVDGAQSAGMHTVVWDGRDDGGSYVETGAYQVVLSLDGGYEEDASLDALCGDDLAVPVRDRIANVDVAVAFAVGLVAPTSGSLTIHDAAGGPAIRTLHDGAFVAGVTTFVWDLLDAGGHLVPSGDYRCRLDTSGYDEDVVFAIMTDFEPAAMTVRLRGADGEIVNGGLDPSEPAVLLTPILEGWVEFDRPLTAEEWEIVPEYFSFVGGLGYTCNEGVEFYPDSSGAHLPVWNICNGAVWADFFGPSSMHANIPWIQPGDAYFHLRHEFSGITPTDETCTIVGEPDTTDWNCVSYSGERSPAAGRDDLPVMVSLAPACPNPTVSDPADPVAMYFELPAALQVEFFVVDTDGAVARVLGDGVFPAGYHVFHWDWRDDAGDLVTEGLYRVFLRARFAGEPSYPQCTGDVQLGSLTATPLPVAGGGLRLMAAPNPFGRTAGVRLESEVPDAATVRLEIHDLVGRRVRTLVSDEFVDKGRHPWLWDGLDDAGRSLPAGVYFARLQDGRTTATRKIVLLD